MINLFRRHVGAKIAWGYVGILALMLAIGLLAVVRLDRVSATLSSLTGDLEVDQQLASQIVRHILSARFYAARYVNSYSQADLDAFNSEYTQMQGLLSQARLSNPERSAVLMAIEEAVNAYGAAFTQVTDLTRQQQQIQMDVLDVQGLVLDNKLSALRVYANTFNHPLVSLSFSNAQNYTQSMRVNLLRYRLEADERYTVLVGKNYQQALDAFSKLQPLLPDPTQRQNAADAVTALQAYYQGFQTIQADTVALHHLFSDQLDRLEPEITRLALVMQENVQQDFQQQNAASQALALQTRWMLMVATTIAIGLGLFLAAFISSRITRPLLQVHRAAQQIADVDLQNLTRQLSSLSRGDVRLDLRVTAQPLEVRLEDEVGQMGRSFNQVINRLHEAEVAFGQMSAYLQEMAGAAQGVARGDLDVQVSTRSGEDVLGNAIGDMLANLRRAQERANQQMERLETLRRVDSLIAASHEICDTLQFLLDQAISHLKVDAGEVYLTNPATCQLERVSCIGAEPACAEPALPMAEYVARTNRRLLVDHSAGDLLADGELNEACGAALQTWAACCGAPLVAQGETRGVLLLFSQRALALEPEWLDFLDTLAGQAAIAIANSELLHNLEERVALRTQELEAARRFMQLLLLSSPVAVAVTDLEHRLTEWSPAAVKLFGYRPDEVLGQNIDDVVARNQPELHAEAVQISRQTFSGNLLRTFTRRTRKDGSLVDVEIVSTGVMVNDQQVANLTMYHDITELQQARQAAEEATRAKSDFLATMSHEIRTPMNGVIGMTSLLLDTPLTAEQHEFVETIRQSGEALLIIINDILDYSKIEAGHLELENQPFGLNQCLESALDLVAQNAARRGIELAYLTTPGLPEAVYGDVTRLRQILVNLLSNAIKFTEQGEVVVGVERLDGADSPAGCYTLHFSVRDTGIGIPAVRMDRLFRSFSQVDPSTTRKYGGTGLGLAICKRLTELMGGRIWVESKGVAGEGSIFHFTIQVRPATDLPTSPIFSSLPSLAGKRALMVDDNATNRQVLHHMAQAWGMIVTLAASGHEALAWIERGAPFDIAVLDVQMPEMDGLTLALEISKRRSAQELPLVMLTSLGRRDPLPPEVTPAAYLYKPIKASALYNTFMSIFAVRPERSETTQPGSVQFDANLGARHPLRILLAEDHPVNQKVALNILERMGYRADVAANGLEVLEAFDRQGYDVVLMDVQMPEMDGVETTLFLRGNLPPERQPRIIALTANVLPGDRERYLAAGMNDYISKPLPVEQLQHLLEQCRPLGRSAPENGAPAAAPVAAPQAQPAPQPASAAAPAIDLAQLGEYFPERQQDPDSFAQMAILLIQDTEARLQGLRQFVAAGDSEQTWHAAHAIKGASLTFGAVYFAALCKELELIGKSGALDGAPATLEQIEAEYQRFRAELIALAHLES